MPHALSERQKDYLHFIEKYIQENQDTPSLKEVAEFFGVKSPTAHKTLKALQNKGYIVFDRDPISGFYIRLVERGGMGEKIFPLFIWASIDQYGEVTGLFDILDPEEQIKHGKGSETDLPEFIPILQQCNDPHYYIGIRATHIIPQAGIDEGDILVVDVQKMPQTGFMSMLPVGPDGRLFLCWSLGKTADDRYFAWEMREPYPLPEKFVDWDLGQRMFWTPIAWDEETNHYFSNLGEIAFPDAPIPMQFSLATAVELIREY